MFAPSKTIPRSAVNPVVTVVTVQGIVAPGVTMETDPLVLAVQIRLPSKARPVVPSPGVATVTAAPAAWLGSIWESFPVPVQPETKTRSIADSAANGNDVPVQVSRSLPSLPRTRETELPVKFGTQTSAPSQAGIWGAAPTVVKPRTVSFCGVQNLSSAARRLPRFNAPSTVRERKAAIWSRVTLPAGSYVVAVVPVVIPR